MEAEEQDGQFAFSLLMLTIASLYDVSSNAKAETPSPAVRGQQRRGCGYTHPPKFGDA